MQAGEEESEETVSLKSEVAKAKSEEYTRAAITWLTRAGFPPPVLEYHFHPLRRWRFDLAYPADKIAIEIEGGTWTGGRHVNPQGYAGDLEKYNQAWLWGWGVLRYTPDKIISGDFIADIEAAMRNRAQQ